MIKFDVEKGKLYVQSGIFVAFCTFAWGVIGAWNEASNQRSRNSERVTQALESIGDLSVWAREKNTQFSITSAIVRQNATHLSDLTEKIEDLTGAVSRNRERISVLGAKIEMSPHQ